MSQTRGRPRSELSILGSEPINNMPVAGEMPRGEMGPAEFGGLAQAQSGEMPGNVMGLVQSGGAGQGMPGEMPRSAMSTAESGTAAQLKPGEMPGGEMNAAEYPAMGLGPMPGEADNLKDIGKPGTMTLPGSWQILLVPVSAKPS